MRTILMELKTKRSHCNVSIVPVFSGNKIVLFFIRSNVIHTFRLRMSEMQHETTKWRFSRKCVFFLLFYPQSNKITISTRSLTFISGRCGPYHFLRFDFFLCFAWKLFNVHEHVALVIVSSTLSLLLWLYPIFRIHLKSWNAGHWHTIPTMYIAYWILRWILHTVQSTFTSYTELF